MRIFTIDRRFLFLIAVLYWESAYSQEASYPVIVNHPALEKGDSKAFDLWELRGDSSQLEGYFLDTESVICFDHICKVVPVRIFWDPIGRYQQYELAEGIILEKKEGEPFSPEDYARLHEILSDTSSPYRDLSYYEITHERIRDEGEVDAVTGPSPIYLNENETVQGAAWTCFTLWHWVNGELVREIQKITGKALSLPELQVHIQTQDPYRQVFALNELIQRREYDSLMVEKVVEQVSVSDSEQQFFKRVLLYLEQAPPETYYASLPQLLKASSKGRRITLWNSIHKQSTTPIAGYFDHFCDKLLERKDYQEIDLFLTILEQKKASTPAILTKLAPLLEDEYSIVNRRVYWYLSNQELSDSQKQMLESYYDQYADNL